MRSTAPSVRPASASTSTKRKQGYYYDDAPEKLTTPTKFKPSNAQISATKASTLGSSEIIDLTEDDPPETPVKKKQRISSGSSRTPVKSRVPFEEKRVRAFRKHPPKSFLERKYRATTQR